MSSTTRRRIDWLLIMATISLLIVGYIMIFSTTSFKGLSEFNDPYFFIKRHSLFLCIGLILFGVGMRLPIDFYKKYAVWGYVSALILLILTFISGWGVELGGSNRWVSLWKIQFQPVEIVKFWWSVAVSVVISNKKCQLNSFRQGILPLFIVMSLPIIFLMMQPDLGNTVLIAMVGFSLMLLSNIRLWILGTATAIGTMLVSISIAVYPYQLKRIESFLNPWQDPLGANYHIIQSFTAIGSGGIFGFGIGESRLKYFYLPLHYSDFIFSILCEEGGLLLAIIVVILFCAIFFRGIQISMRQPDQSFQQFLSVALVGFLVYQAFINICVVTGLFPITGIPLTLISYGGTSLLSSLFCLGVLHRLGTTS